MKENKSICLGNPIQEKQYVNSSSSWRNFERLRFEITHNSEEKLFIMRKDNRVSSIIERQFSIPSSTKKLISYLIRFRTNKD
jgi:hypothetical protein